MLNDIYVVGKVGASIFLLKLNENFKKEISNSNNNLFNSIIYHEEKWIEPDAYKAYKDDYRLKIIFPNQAQAIIVVSPDLLISYLFKALQSKINFDPNKHSIQYWDYEEKKMKKFTKDLANCTLKMVKIYKLEILNLKNENSDTDTNTISEKENKNEDDIFLPTTLENYAYVEFNVVKTNKFGVKMDRIFGIDGFNIYNKKLQSYKLFGGSKTTHPTRSLKTLTSVTTDKDNQKSFTLCFVDESNNSKEFQYFETKTKIECEEVVKRLNDLIKLYQNK
jgi:hypothetical protein